MWARGVVGAQRRPTDGSGAGAERPARRALRPARASARRYRRGDLAIDTSISFARRAAPRLPHPLAALRVRSAGRGSSSPHKHRSFGGSADQPAFDRGVVGLTARCVDQIARDAQPDSSPAGRQSSALNWRRRVAAGREPSMTMSLRREQFAVAASLLSSKMRRHRRASRSSSKSKKAARRFGLPSVGSCFPLDPTTSAPRERAAEGAERPRPQRRQLGTASRRPVAVGRWPLPGRPAGVCAANFAPARLLRYPEAAGRVDTAFG